MAVEQNALAAARPFGELLREHRLAAGLAQEALAERARLSVETVSALERGVRQRPYRETIALLAQALSLSDKDRAGLERAAKRGSVRMLAAIEASDTNLPVQLSTFVGRERDVANVEELLAAYRLVTLVGAGGVGKTRLALAVGAQSLPGRHDSVWFVDLSGYADVATIPTAIGSGVGLSNVPHLDRLVAYLRPKNALLILDNCEHLIEGVAQTVAALLQSSPDLQIMATSRQALAIAGERIYRVPPLSFPEIECDPPTVGEAMKYGAIKLFVERAKGADSRFELSERNVGAVAEIVRRLDGIALAIELAAARTNVFSPASIAQRIEEHVFLLTGGRAPLPRQKTMHSVLEWSYDLLDAHERRLFHRLSVFAGSFSLELATAAFAEGDDAPAVADVLVSLVDKSLIQSEPLPDVVRYRLLEPIRQYAREKLRGEGGEREAARAHAFALLTLAEGYDSKRELTPDSVWQTQLEPERENYRAAFDWALSSGGDASIAQRLASSRTATSFGTGEALRWTEAALATCDGATPKNVVAKLETSHARTTLVLHGDPKAALAAAERALALRTDDPRTFAEAQLHAGLSLLRAGSIAEGEMRMRNALAVASRDAPYDRLLAQIMQSLATAYAAAGNFSAARESSWEALRLLRASGGYRLAAMDAPNLAEFEFADGHVATALELTLESIAYLREHRIWLELGWALGNASAYFIAENRFDEARTHARESLVLAYEAGRGAYVALALQHLAAVAALDPSRAGEVQNFASAANLLGYVNEWSSRAGFRRETTEQREYDRIVPVLREKAGTRFDQLLCLGSSWPEDRAVAEALELP